MLFSACPAWLGAPVRGGKALAWVTQISPSTENPHGKTLPSWAKAGCGEGGPPRLGLWQRQRLEPLPFGCLSAFH